MLNHAAPLGQPGLRSFINAVTNTVYKNGVSEKHTIRPNNIGKALGEMWHSEIYQEFGATGSELQVSAHKRMKIKILVKFMASQRTGVLL